MIIDEGFLSNAKKISAEYPHKREVKVPEIKRENYEYQVTIMAMGRKFIFYRVCCLLGHIIIE